jgi:hypothetical protein
MSAPASASMASSPQQAMVGGIAHVLRGTFGGLYDEDVGGAGATSSAAGAGGAAGAVPMSPLSLEELQLVSRPRALASPPSASAP